VFSFSFLLYPCFSFWARAGNYNVFIGRFYIQCFVKRVNQIKWHNMAGRHMGPRYMWDLYLGGNSDLRRQSTRFIAIDLRMFIWFFGIQYPQIRQRLQENCCIWHSKTKFPPHLATKHVSFYKHKLELWELWSMLVWGLDLHMVYNFGPCRGIQGPNQCWQVLGLKHVWV